MKRKILLSAFACDPVTGSEPYVGWNWAMLLADDYDVHVLTRKFSHSLITGHPQANKVSFHFVDFLGCESRDHHWRYIKPYYVLWQILILFQVLALQSRHSFEIIHHVTYNTIDVPGFLWLTPRAHFVWGPVGAGQTSPPSLAAVYGDQWWKERVRGVVKSLTRYNPVIRAAIKRAAIVLVVNQETADRLAGLRFRLAMMVETAISAGCDCEPPICKGGDGKLRLLWLSHVFPGKGLTLALDGFRRALDRDAGRTDMKLMVIGAGVDLLRAKDHASRIGLSEHVAFLGAVPHSEVDRCFAENDAFLFTSVRDTSGNVLLEAMRNAKPIIALNHQGAKAMITQGGARLVEIGTYDETADGLGRAIVELAHDPSLRRQMGRLAFQEVRARHTWAAKRLQILDIYAQLLCERKMG
jgi:glycosyltransferase involved in cell wall biosynthesis